MTTICLAMLARNEEDHIAAALKAAQPVVDEMLVIDTGSNDATITEATTAGAHVVERAWRGFAANRTELLAEARDRADYTLMLDADHTLHVHGDKPQLAADAYTLKIEGELEWRLPLLTRNKHPFEYRGAAHAYLASDEPVSIEPTGWLSIDGGGGASVEKLERDRVLLEQAWLDDPTDTRTTFYLAETYRFLGHHEQAIRFYLLRADMAGFEEERWFARYMAGVLLGGHVSGLQGAEQLVKAWRERPSRAEALRALARLADAVADKLDQPDDVLFVTPSAYRKTA